MSGQVSPGFMPRPSLSDNFLGFYPNVRPGVAGVYAPAFVERSIKVASISASLSGVAGVYAPAFVERDF